MGRGEGGNQRDTEEALKCNTEVGSDLEDSGDAVFDDLRDPADMAAVLGLGSSFERNFWPFYCLDAGEQVRSDMMVLLNVNQEIVVVCLAPSHPLRQPDRCKVLKVQIPPELTEVNPLFSNFKARQKWNLKVTPRTILATVKLTDGTDETIVAGIEGTLLEPNVRLVREPRLLQDDPEQDGFLAVLH